MFDRVVTPRGALPGRGAVRVAIHLDPLLRDVHDPIVGNAVPRVETELDAAVALIRSVAALDQEDGQWAVALGRANRDVVPLQVWIWRAVLVHAQRPLNHYQFVRHSRAQQRVGALAD